MIVGVLTACHTQ